MKIELSWWISYVLFPIFSGFKLLTFQVLTIKTIYSPTIKIYRKYTKFSFIQTNDSALGLDL
jgi:hypothetical protein